MNSKINQATARPWAVRPAHLFTEPLAVVTDRGTMWAFAQWDIIGPRTERTVTQVGCSSDNGAWSPTENRNEAIANCHLIVAAVNSHEKLCTLAEMIVGLRGEGIGPTFTEDAWATLVGLAEAALLEVNQLNT